MGFLTKKKEKKEIEPQYYNIPVINVQAYNYKVYHMSKLEKVLTFLVGFVAGAFVGYLFYGGLGKDQYGNATMVTYVCNVVISGLVGLIAGKMILPIRNKQIVENQKKKLRMQFRDMLEAVSTSLGAGNNVMNSFQSSLHDLSVQYDPDAYILQELRIILNGLENNMQIEDLLENFGERSGIDDITSFANVFRICYRKGGNIRDTIRSTYDIISDKMNINEQIDTVVAGSKMDQNIMIVLPIVLIGVIKMMSPDFAANFATVTGVLSTTFAILIFVGAYFVGKSILNIKV